MSKNSPVSSGLRYVVFKQKNSRKSSSASKQQSHSLVFTNLGKFSGKNTEHIQKQCKKSYEDIMDTLIIVEKEYVRSLLTLKKSVNLIEACNQHQTPERKIVKKIKKKKPSFEGNKHVRKLSTGRKYDSNCNSPFSGKVSRILFN